MFRSVAYRMGSVLQEAVRPAGCLNAVSGVRNMSHGPVESDEEFDKRYIAYFNRPNLDGWDCRKAMNDLAGMDLVPDPLIINAAFRACRRLNDYSLAVRFFETCKDKCGERVKEIYPYLLQECGPTMQELGIDTPEQLGYDKPELGLETVFERE